MRDVGGSVSGDSIAVEVVGSMGMAPSANLNPSGDFPSMFEPVHGSAPDIAGKGVANPIGQIWSAAMMWDHLGRPEAHDLLMGAIHDVLSSGEVRTPDLGGSSSTAEVTDAIKHAILERHKDG